MGSHIISILERKTIWSRRQSPIRPKTLKSAWEADSPSCENVKHKEWIYWVIHSTSLQLHALQIRLWPLVQRSYLLLPACTMKQISRAQLLVVLIACPPSVLVWTPQWSACRWGEEGKGFPNCDMKLSPGPLEIMICKILEKE